MPVPVPRDVRLGESTSPALLRAACPASETTTLGGGGGPVCQYRGFAAIEAAVGVVAGEGVRVVDGDPAANPSPVEDLTAVRATD